MATVSDWSGLCQAEANRSKDLKYWSRRNNLRVDGILKTSGETLKDCKVRLQQFFQENLAENTLLKSNEHIERQAEKIIRTMERIRKHRNIETYILSKKLYNGVYIYTKSVWIKSYNMYIIGSLCGIVGDTDIRFKLGFYWDNFRHVR